VADKEKKSQKLTIEEETGTILLNRKPIEEYFTRQEYTVLSLMIRKGGRLCSRDDIGEALWGEDSYEKYSNWAIDQLISKLRKKIKKLGIKNGLKTIRGRGYKLTL
jgi:DNA-binding response OmpR family regulator